MKPLIEIIAELPQQEFAAGDFLITQNSPPGNVYIIASGEVRIVKDDIEICIVSEVGSIFGEVSSLTNQKTTASVQALTPVKAHTIEHPMQFALDHPVAVYLMAVQLAKRLSLIDAHFAQVKKDYQGLYRRLSQISMI
ncbi:MAG: cyclic nucleotide-binding domain-containing protein [Verrucomicrobiota bacterium]|nr:cyclic nucleotide-binding domain-containing protein [Verrucomicrobiota bacterium]